VISFAMVVPLQAIVAKGDLWRRPQNTDIPDKPFPTWPGSSDKELGYIALWVGVLLFIAAIGMQIRAEFECLAYLRHVSGYDDRDGFITGVIVWSMAWLLGSTGAYLIIRGIFEVENSILNGLTSAWREWRQRRTPQDHRAIISDSFQMQISSHPRTALTV
jgi:hypothetical protein